MCPGYLDKFDVLVRHRTSKGQQLYQAIPTENAQASASQTVDRPRRYGKSPGSTPTAFEPEGDPLTVLPQLPFDPDAVALAMFYGSFCVDGSHIWSTEYVQSQGNGCLFAAIRVMGDLEINRKWTSTTGTQTLAKNYFEAIRSLNSALASPTESTKDSTLLATLILSAVETKAAPSLSLDYWEAHTQGKSNKFREYSKIGLLIAVTPVCLLQLGAAGLLQLRGADQVTSRLGGILFFQVASQLTTLCLLTKRPIPQDLLDLRDAVRLFVLDANDPVWKHQGAMFRLTNFLALRETDRPDPDIDNARAILTEARSIHDDLSEVFVSAGPVWRYQTVESTKFPGLLEYEHSYNTVLAAQLWNAYRTATILLWTVIVKVASQWPCLVVQDPDIQAISGEANNIINREALETIAAVPQVFTLIGNRAAHHTPPYVEKEGDLCGGRRDAEHKPVFVESKPDSQPLPYMHGCLLQWSIYFAADCEYVEFRVRQCLLHLLESAAQQMQIRQWQILVDKLKPKLILDTRVQV